MTSLLSKLIVPYRYYSLFQRSELLTESYCPDDAVYLTDSTGNVHYFKYIGVNLHDPLRGLAVTLEGE